MSTIQEEITRIKNAKADIKDAIDDIEGGEVGALIDTYADAIRFIYQEEITISLLSNQSSTSDLNGAVITIKNGSTTVCTYTWSGSDIVVVQNKGLSLTVSVSGIEGYSTPADITFTTEARNKRSISFTYQTEIVTVSVSATDGASVAGQIITVNGVAYTYSSPFSVKIPYGTTYSISANDKEGSYITPTTQTFTANQESRSVALSYVYSTAILTYFVDSDGANALTQNTGIDTSWITGKRCLVKKTSSGVAICYLSDTNSELFHDGTTTAKLDGTMGQWMTDVPEYYFSVDESTSGTHVLNIYRNKQDTAKKSRRVLVGVTEAVNVGSKLWSKKGGQSTGSLTSKVFHTYANNLGTGFDIIDYETHCKIAHLFYTKYANRNPQTMDKFGYGEDSYTRTIGTTSSLGNADGKTSTQISFLGIEDFYGGKYEWMGGIHGNGSVYYIYDGFQPDAVPTVDYRTIDVGGSYRTGWISKVTWGEYGDMIPTEVSGSATTHYCDYGYVAYSGWRVAWRSFYYALSYGGVACFYACDSSGNSGAHCGSRIQYRGDITIIDNPSEFIALPVGF